ncbi:acetyltransferase [Pararhodobacter oceanensis]|uniref:Acetyltransferase n=1 Tax=Pararhodobacter oceanensis TaxID=2172121 RepID=A0A2T8HPI6_9RHOB|nr:acetyltransferase [Pararhodobacter oceanensis]PVH27354.1 acetyltransferase [Pararhodobacter oceanensis]
MKLFGVYGASGFGREVMPLLRQQLEGEGNVECVFVDDGGSINTVNGHKSISFDEFRNHPAERRFISIAIGAGETRVELAKRCANFSIPVLNIRAVNSIVMDNVTIGDGHILCAFTTITSNVSIGRHFHANIYSYVAHDCVIGDFVTFAPGVMCNGNVRVEDHAYVGTGAVLRQGAPDKPLVIGEGAIVGMGAVVTRDVRPWTTVVGNPAKPLIKE